MLERNRRCRMVPLNCDTGLNMLLGYTWGADLYVLARWGSTIASTKDLGRVNTAALSVVFVFRVHGGCLGRDEGGVVNSITDIIYDPFSLDIRNCRRQNRWAVAPRTRMVFHLCCLLVICVTCSRGLPSQSMPFCVESWFIR